MSLESERRSSGAQLEVQRRSTGRQIADDINRLVEPTRKSTALPVLEKRGTLEAKKGKGVYDPANVPKSGGGIASPLTETDFTKRVYWPGGELSSDGLFNFPTLKTLTMTDNDGAEVIINLAQPVTPTAAP
jgi:hypothetical protein